jgi:single-strand DNA-binding protein
MNKVILTGRLTADPELRQSQSGVASCKFTIACDRRFANKQTGQREADFISCLAFKNTAEFISRYFNKGKMIAVEGSLRTGSYKDKKHDDVTHYTTDVLVDNVEFCGDKGQAQTPDTQNSCQYSAPPQEAAPQQPYGTYGELSDYEEILSDGDTPF